jgi:inner membrane protein
VAPPKIFVDNVTHTLVALTLSRTRLGRAVRGTTAALVIASNAPDIDAFAAARGGIASYLQWHRGPTHGLLGIVGLGALTAGIVWVGGRLRHQADADGPRASFAMLLAISMLGVLLHILMDLPTPYGTRLLSPFDWHWFGADWMPIIDIYLLVVLAACLAFGRGSPESRRRNAAIALVLMSANYGLRATAHHRALALAPRVFGPTLPQPCSGRPPDEAFIDRWPPPPSISDGQPARRCLIEIAAIPTFISPFRWRIVAHLSNAYELHDLDLLDPRFLTPAPHPEGIWRTTVRYPDVWTPPVVAATRARSAQIFLGFSRFPAARSLTEPTGITTVRWTDMRFVGGLVTPRQPTGQPQRFTATVRVDANSRILTDQISP